MQVQSPPQIGNKSCIYKKALTRRDEKIVYFPGPFMDREKKRLVVYVSLPP
jgi:hypothetical protein